MEAVENPIERRAEATCRASLPKKRRPVDPEPLARDSEKEEGGRGDIPSTEAKEMEEEEG